MQVAAAVETVCRQLRRGWDEATGKRALASSILLTVRAAVGSVQERRSPQKSVPEAVGEGGQRDEDDTTHHRHRGCAPGNAFRLHLIQALRFKNDLRATRGTLLSKSRDRAHTNTYPQPA